MGILRFFVKNLLSIDDIIQNTAFFCEQLMEGIAVKGALGHPQDVLCLKACQQVAHGFG